MVQILKVKFQMIKKCYWNLTGDDDIDKDTTKIMFHPVGGEGLGVADII